MPDEPATSTSSSSTPPTPRTPVPTLGQIVHYRLTQQDAAEISRRRTNSAAIRNMIVSHQWPAGAQAHIGNPVYAGEEVPLVVVVVWPNEFGERFHGINGQVLLDGNDSLWVTSVRDGTEPGTWHWPEAEAET